jgi:hypothetical protein
VGGVEGYSEVWWDGRCLGVAGLLGRDICWV